MKYNGKHYFRLFRLPETRLGSCQQRAEKTQNGFHKKYGKQAAKAYYYY